MQIKYLAILIAVSQGVIVAADVSAANYWQGLTSQINPENVTVPEIAQTTSQDPSVECKYYSPDSRLFQFNASEWPTIWQTATTNGQGESSEFLSLYNSIDWSQAPAIAPRRLTAEGGLDFSGYAADDPDCWWSASTCTQPKRKDVYPDIYRCPEPETWGLTFDDGPNCSHNAFYDFLSQHQLKATLFYIGSNVVDWPYGALRGLKDGHHLAAHTWSHQYTTTLTNAQVLAEFYYTQKAIKLATGLTPRYWRPPYGDIDDRVRWIATQLNLTAVLWNLDTDDWAAGLTTTVQAVESTYGEYIQMGTNGTFADSGTIVLTHEINNNTMAMAVENLPKILQAYRHVVDVATCQNITFPYFENIPWTLTAAPAHASAQSTVLPATTVGSAAVTSQGVVVFGRYLPRLGFLVGMLVLCLIE
ncbi:chitin deacetylase [Sporodiniella umbellata]|nr:chitin deacetylase [Sporodiniella umbellata]